MQNTLQALALLLLLQSTLSSALFGDSRWSKTSYCCWGQQRRQRNDNAFHVLVLRGGGQESSSSLVQNEIATVLVNTTTEANSMSSETTILDDDAPSTVAAATTLVQNQDTTIPLINNDKSSDAMNDATTSTNSTVPDIATAASTTTTAIPAWKADLPPLLQRKGNRTLQRLVLGNVEIYLLGTAHVSNDSCLDVQVLLESVNPACIFVELCDARVPLLEGNSGNDDDDMMETTANNNNSETSNDKQQRSWGQRVAHIQESQGGSKWQAICTLLLTSVQEDYAETLGVELGGEFHVAHEYWKGQRRQQQNSYQTTQFPVLILGDRPLSLTLVRAWESLRWWPKLKVMAGLLWSSFSKPKPEEIRAWLESVLREESDVLTESLAELRQHFPTLHTTIIAERDAWLACKLLQTCRVLRGTATGGKRARLVAIVGAGHVPGIVQTLTGSNPEYGADQSAEDILLSLCQTKKWQSDDVIQKQVIPQWVNDVTQVQDPVF